MNWARNGISYKTLSITSLKFMTILKTSFTFENLITWRQTTESAVESVKYTKSITTKCFEIDFFFWFFFASLSQSPKFKNARVRKLAASLFFLTWINEWQKWRLCGSCHTFFFASDLVPQKVEVYATKRQAMKLFLRCKSRRYPGCSSQNALKGF